MASAFEKQYPEFADLPSLSTLKSALLDGEIAVLDRRRARPVRVDSARASQPLAVKSDRCSRRTRAQLVVFDLLYLDGYDLRGVLLESRKNLLERCRSME